jgi:hypothetical protein
MFSCLTNLVWGAQEETDAQSAVEAAQVEHSTREEEDEWLLITTGAEKTSDQGRSETTSQESECDRESVCSDGSWIITPAPTFRATGSETVAEAGRSLENLLIEHPTMSVYGQVSLHGGREEGGDEERELREREQRRARAEAREMVLLRNRQRYQVARQLHVPVGSNRNHKTESPARPKTDALRVTRKAARRHNNTRQRNARGRQVMSVKKCSFVAGRRRC